MHQIKDGLSFRFVHRFFQEYFAAVYTCKLSDEQQNQLFKLILSEEYVSDEAFYKMLYDMQEERFIKNIILPGAIEIKEIYENDCSLYKIIEFLFDGIGIEKSENDIYIQGICIYIRLSQRVDIIIIFFST